MDQKSLDTPCGTQDARFEEPLPRSFQLRGSRCTSVGVERSTPGLKPPIPFPRSLVPLERGGKQTVKEDEIYTRTAGGQGKRFQCTKVGVSRYVTDYHMERGHGYGLGKNARFNLGGGGFMIWAGEMGLETEFFFGGVSLSRLGGRGDCLFVALGLQELGVDVGYGYIS